MATQLKNIIAHNGITAGAFSTLPHQLNLKGCGLVPDHIELSNGDFAFISADDTYCSHYGQDDPLNGVGFKIENTVPSTSWGNGIVEIDFFRYRSDGQLP